MLSRDELIEKLNEIEFWPEILNGLESYLSSAIYKKDTELVRLLLKVGVSPNSIMDYDCYLLGLLHEYMVTKSSSGVFSLEIMHELLKAGADPNRVAQCNLRAYDYAVNYKITPIVELLEEYGADKKLRESI